jgi:hypothetical protein
MTSRASSAAEVPGEEAGAAGKTPVPGGGGGRGGG